MGRLNQVKFRSFVRVNYTCWEHANTISVVIKRKFENCGYHGQKSRLLSNFGGYYDIFSKEVYFVVIFVISI